MVLKDIEQAFSNSIQHWFLEKVFLFLVTLLTLLKRQTHYHKISLQYMKTFILNEKTKTTLYSCVLSDAMYAILSFYGWSHTVILYDDTNVFFHIAGYNLAYDFRHIPGWPRPYEIPFEPDKVKSYSELLKDAQYYARGESLLCWFSL